MFEKLRNAFREAIDNFYEELHRNQVPEAVDELLRGMRGELTDAKLRIGELETQIRKALAEAEAEKEAAATARRRGEMARKIGDGETAEVAADFTDKHVQRQALLEQKAVALKKELEFRTREYEEMLDKVKEAEAKRDALAATAGRAGARDSIGAADDLFAELDRMAEKIGDEEARGRAAQELADLDLRSDPDAPSEASPDELDARLAELKRRMGRDRK